MHPLDPQDTDWGREVTQRLGLHTSQIRELDIHIANIRTDLKTNTDQTNAIKGDTEWLVNVFKGSRAVGPMLIGVLVALGALATFLGWVLSFAHGGSK